MQIDNHILYTHAPSGRLRVAPWVHFADTIHVGHGSHLLRSIVIPQLCCILYLSCQNTSKNVFDAEDFVNKIFSTGFRDLQNAPIARSANKPADICLALQKYIFVYILLCKMFTNAFLHQANVLFLKIYYLFFREEKTIINFHLEEINIKFKYIFIYKHLSQGKVAERSNASVLKTDVA